MTPALPPIKPADIPQDLLAYVDSFTLPGNIVIRRSYASDIEKFGWVIDFGGRSFLYKDGSRDTNPRNRAYHDLGLTRGDDDLQGKPDEEWRRVQDLQEHYQSLLIMTLDEAWQTVKEQGLPLRYAREGEQVLVPWRDRENNIFARHKATVINDGTKYDEGNYIIVRYDEGPETGTERTYRLSSIELFEQ